MKSKYSIEDGRLFADYTYVYNYSLSLCHNEHLAEEITQEAFLRALKSSKKASEKNFNSAFVCTAAKNYYLDLLKKQKRIVNTDSEIADESQIEEEFSDKDTAIKIHKLLHEMKEPYKEVFTLRVFGELDFSAISEIFAKSEGWSRVTYHRAKKMILENLRKDGV